MHGLHRLWNRQAIRAFDIWAPDYAAVAAKKLHERGYSYEYLALFIQTQLGKPETGLLVEIGTGPGTLGQRLASTLGVKLVGVDISLAMLERIPLGTYYYTICASAEALPLRSASAAGLYSAFALHSVKNRGQALREIRRVLAPCALGVVVDLAPATRGLPVLGLVVRLLHSLRYEHGAPANYVTTDRLVEELLQEGLEVLHVEELGLPKSYRHVAVTFQRTPNEFIA